MFRCEACKTSAGMDELTRRESANGCHQHRPMHDARHARSHASTQIGSELRKRRQKAIHAAANG